MSDQGQEKIQSILQQWGLSQREKDVVLLMAEGITTQKLIADKMNISPLTVRNHLENIYKKSGVSNKCDLMVVLFNEIISEYSKLKPFVHDSKILIIDDEIKICEHLKLALEDRNYQVDILTNASELEESLDKKMYDFVLMDVHMPPASLNGIDLIKSLRKKFEHLHFIVMSGFYDYDMEKALHAGAINFLEKPFRINEVIDLISAHEVQNLQKRFDMFHANTEIAFNIEGSFELTLNDLGLGGVFLPLSEEFQSQMNLLKDQMISFCFSLSEKDLNDINAIGKIRWIRADQPNKRSGLGVEILFVPDDYDYQLKRIAAKESIYSYIPSPS